MPNFFVHWFIAEQALPSGEITCPIRKKIVSGKQEYITIVGNFKKELYEKIKNFSKENDFNTFMKTGFDTFYENNFNKKIKSSDYYDDITCFSAYMLGACGPDFWTLPSEPTSWKIPSMASIHFDLGHYHRTHRQFQVAIKRWKENATLTPLQKAVEQSYFMGMSTHLAADLVVHQLVNVPSGGYKFLKEEGVKYTSGPWENEEGSSKINVWKTHNKVEHYWDSYFRYRYIGDFGPLWGGDRDGKAWSGFHLWDFPVVETMQRMVSQYDFGKSSFISHSKLNRNFIISWLGKDKVRYKIEKCFMLPWVVCDRIIIKNGGLLPFIYDVVVNKTTGAYPTSEIFDEAFKEADSPQMKSEGLPKSELKRLAYFSSNSNEVKANDGPMTWNYLCYIVCPGLKRLRKYGYDIFYPLEALEQFIRAAISTATQFSGFLEKAIFPDKKHKKDINENPLGKLGYFWNLDTGLGLKVENVASDTSHEVITRLNFVHILKELPKGELANVKIDYKYVQSSKYFNYNDDYQGPDEKDSQRWKDFTRKKEEFTNPSIKQPAFQTYKKDEYQNLDSVYEDESAKKSDKYLETIKLKEPGALGPSTISLKDFFQPKPTVAHPSIPRSKGAGSDENKHTYSHIFHRVTLQVDAAILDMGHEVGFYFMGDKTNKIEDAMKQHGNEDDDASKWISVWTDKHTNTGKLNSNNKQTFDFVLTGTDKGRFTKDSYLYHFRSSVLLNEKLMVKDEKEKERSVDKNKWNNVIDDKKHHEHYCRNYAIGTGRKNVLYPTGNDVFDPDTDFSYYQDVTPTENVFFTLLALINHNGECYDLISKEKVEKSKIDEYKKIACMDFVKIVLFYVLDKDGLAQLNKCYIDGLEVPVWPVSS